MYYVVKHPIFQTVSVWKLTRDTFNLVCASCQIASYFYTIPFITKYQVCITDDKEEAVGRAAIEELTGKPVNEVLTQKQIEHAGDLLRAEGDGILYNVQAVEIIICTT